MDMEIGYTLEEICGVLARTLQLPPKWVREQIRMDDRLLESSTDIVPHIEPQDWVDEWQRLHPRNPITGAIQTRLTKLYFAYTQFLHSIPNLCSIDSGQKTNYLG